MRFKGLVAAAGRSSRMDGFKPLLKLNGFPMIQMTVQSLKNAGIRDVTVVTGCRAEEVAQVLEPLGVSVVENMDYARTDMLASVKLGLQSMADADGIFFLPGDVPLVSPESMFRIREKVWHLSAGTQVLQPIVGSREAHPPVLLPAGYEKILQYEGENGLRGAFASMRTETVELKDMGALSDADYRADFEKLEAYARTQKGISREICEGFYQEMELPEHIRAHCRAVGTLAGQMAEKLSAHGACLDIELCRSGGFLHDLCRMSVSHEAAAGLFLRKRGYLALAEVVESHKGFSKEPKTICRESVIVCLADKLVQETRRVPLEVRYQKALERQPVKERIRKDIRICRRLMEEFEVITGERL